MSLTQDAWGTSPGELPNLKLFALCLAVLWLKMQALGMMTVKARKDTGTYLNAEDADHRGTPVATQESPRTERTLRAHRNDVESIYPFLFMALTAILLGCPQPLVAICLVVFTLARIGHTVAYLRAAQPWRSLSWGIGLACTFTLLGASLVRIAARWGS